MNPQVNIILSVLPLLLICFLPDYLDRESLAALIEALKVFEGGVLVITHNRDFSESLCKEVWAMRDGHLEASGHNWVEGQGAGPRIDKGNGEEDDQFDAMGNKIDSKKAKKITASDARKVSGFFFYLEILSIFIPFYHTAKEGAPAKKESRTGVG